jgi:hypothetical protein
MALPVFLLPSGDIQLVPMRRGIGKDHTPSSPSTQVTIAETGSS